MFFLVEKLVMTIRDNRHREKAKLERGRLGRDYSSSNPIPLFPFFSLETAFSFFFGLFVLVKLREGIILGRTPKTYSPHGSRHDVSITLLIVFQLNRNPSFICHRTSTGCTAKPKPGHSARRERALRGPRVR